MGKKSKAKKRVISILVSMLMIFQCLTVYGAEVTPKVDDWATFVPDEVKGKEYKEVPTYYNGKLVTEFDKYLRRYNDVPGKADKLFDYSGIAKFRVKSYIYKTGDKAKIGSYVEQLKPDGNWELLRWADKDGIATAADYDLYAKGEKPLKVDIDINFAYPNGNSNQNEGKIDVTTSWKTSFSANTGLILFYTTDGVLVDRTVTEVAGEKNMWEVQVKVQGRDKVESVPTDVVFVLDRSGSMNETRRQLVSNATQKLADSLLDLEDVNVGLVTFGQYAGAIPDKGAKYYDENWNTVRLTVAERNKKYKDEDDRKKWAGATVDEDFTDDKEDIKDSIKTKLKSVSGGTPISLALIEATRMFMDEEYLEDTNNGKDTKKVIILVSDGAPSFSRDGGGTGNINENSEKSWQENQYIVDDTIAVSKEALDKVDNLTIFTLAAGNGISDKGKDVLKQCASASDYAYTANDSQAELDAVMNKIATTIENDIATGVTLSEELTQNISIDCSDADKDHKVSSVKLTNAEKGQTEEVDWKKTTIAITQGAIVESDDHKLNWNIGQLKDGEPAIIKYRINLDSGKLGQLYNISKDSNLIYTNSKGEVVSQPVPNKQIDLSWAKIKMTTFDQSTNVVVDESELELWYKVPEVFTPDSMKFNYNLGYNSGNKEISSTGNKVVKDSIDLSVAEGSETPVVIGTVVDDKSYAVSQMDVVGAAGASLTQSPTIVTNLINKPTIKSESNEDENCIQPEGSTNVSANITFASKSKDVSFQVDLSNLIDAKMNGTTVMTYKFDAATVVVRKVNEGGKLLVEGTDYTISKSGDTVIVDFLKTVEEEDEFRVDIYAPTFMGENITYNSAGTSYLNTIKGTTIKVDNIIKSTPKVSDFVLEDGSVVEVYGVETAVDSKDVEDNKIILTYKDLATVS